MKAKNTWTLVALAAALFAFIWFFERHFQENPDAAKRAWVLPEFVPSMITSIEVSPAGQLEIRAERSNNVWTLAKPFAYRARAAAIDALLAALQKLPGHNYVSAEELKNRPDSNKEFGFDTPQLSLTFNQGGARRQVLVGKRTALGDEVFLQVVGVEGVYVVDATVLNYFPRTANDWRDPLFADLRTVSFDRISVTNAGKTFELQRPAAAGESGLAAPKRSDGGWRMTQPIKARADNLKIEDLLRRLHNARVEQFVSDDPKTDVEPLGLQPPELALGFARGTNALLSLLFGKSPTNDASRIFAKVSGQNSVVLLPRNLVEPWRAESYNDFRERRLVSIEISAVKQIEVHGPAASSNSPVAGEENFVLRRKPSGAWELAGVENLTPDASAILELLRDINNLEVTQFVPGTATDVDFRDRGLMPPTSQYILKTTVTTTNGFSLAATNPLLAEIHFGSTNDNRIFVRRADENYIYAVNLADYLALPRASWQFRERRIWNFSANDVARVTTRQRGKVREMLRGGTNSWSFASGSQGILNVFGVEEAVHQLGRLAAFAWAGRGEDTRKQFGFDENSFQVSVEVKKGDKTETVTVDFAGMFSARQHAYAAVHLDGQTWIFECPRAISELAELYLTIPAAP